MQARVLRLRFGLRPFPSDASLGSKHAQGLRDPAPGPIDWFAWSSREQFPPQLLAAALPEFCCSPQRSLARWCILLFRRRTQQAVPIWQRLLAHSLRPPGSRSLPIVQDHESPDGNWLDCSHAGCRLGGGAAAFKPCTQPPSFQLLIGDPSCPSLCCLVGSPLVV